MYAVKSEAGASTAENICSLRGFRQDLSGLFSPALNSGTSEGNALSSSGRPCPSSVLLLPHPRFVSPALRPLPEGRW